MEWIIKTYILVAWFGTCFISPYIEYIGNNNSNWRTHTFQRVGIPPTSTEFRGVSRLLPQNGNNQVNSDLPVLAPVRILILPGCTVNGSFMLILSVFNRFNMFQLMKSIQQTLNNICLTNEHHSTTILNNLHWLTSSLHPHRNSEVPQLAEAYLGLCRLQGLLLPSEDVRVGCGTTCYHIDM